MHSHSYRGPSKKFEGKRVLLVGTGPSALDILHQLLDQDVKRVILSGRTFGFLKKSKVL
jgi:cation diffusion facilitator CzcD-associated flavoprotein CzcO